MHVNHFTIQLVEGAQHSILCREYLFWHLDVFGLGAPPSSLPEPATMLLLGSGLGHGRKKILPRRIQSVISNQRRPPVTFFNESTGLAIGLDFLTKLKICGWSFVFLRKIPETTLPEGGVDLT